MKLKKRQVLERLKTVIDPELGVSIVDLGLIYKVEIKYRPLSLPEQNLADNFNIIIQMTLTSPGCPLASVIDSMIREAVGDIDGVSEVKIDLVWDPPWGVHMISEEARAELGLG